MEKVQFQLEATLPELKDLEEKKLFTKSELRQITRRRTRFESALIKRVAQKEDFFGYAEYEIGLEKLRKVRWQKLGYNKSRPPRSISDHSIRRRIAYILRRASEKFPYDLEVWMAYHDYAKSEGMVKVVRELLTKALQLHPLEPSLYILLAQQYLDPGAPVRRANTHSSSTHKTHFSLENVSPARKALLLGLRFLPSDRSLWIEYIKLEIGWVEALRRRWQILGIAQDGPSTGGDGAEAMDTDVQAGLPRPTTAGEEEEADLGQNAFGQAGESARKAIMRGDLIRTVLESSFQKLGHDLAYVQDLLRLLRSYPTALRSLLLDVIYAHMLKDNVLKRNCKARRIVLEAELYDRAYQPDEPKIEVPEDWVLEDDETRPTVVDGEALVLGLASVTDKLRAAPEGFTKQQKFEWNQEVGFWFLRWAQRTGDNEDLRDFLLANLESLVEAAAKPSAALLKAHLNYLHAMPSGPSKKEMRARIKRYSCLHPHDADLWSERMEAEIQARTDDAQLSALYLQGMTALADSPDAGSFWITAMQWFDARAGTSKGVMPDHWKHALVSAQGRAKGEEIRTLYSDLMGAWVENRLADDMDLADAILDEALSTRWDVPVAAMSTIFELYSELPIENTRRRLERIYNRWRLAARSPVSKVEATLTWCRWLLLRHKGGAKDAHAAQDVTKREVEAMTAPSRGATSFELEQAKKVALSQLESCWVELLQEVEQGVADGETGSFEDGEDEDMSDE